MADRVTSKTRSRIMAAIHGRDTEPELKLRRAMSAAHLRYRVNWRIPSVKVHVDIASPKRRIAIFVDGCFWHGCPKHAIQPRTNVQFWSNKLLGNKERDRCQTMALRRIGWSVIRIWEHDLDGTLNAMRRILRVWHSGRRNTRQNERMANTRGG